MTHKQYCMSSYLAFRYIVDDDKDFYDCTSHMNYSLLPLKDRICVNSAKEMDLVIGEQVQSLAGERCGLFLSGGMDSAILASYMKGADAYTFRFCDGEWQREELSRAEVFAQKNDMKLHYVDISWESIQTYLELTMMAKGAPVHSIEPQLAQAAQQAKDDGVSKIVIGNAADYVFGGMDKLLSRDWKYEDFVKRYIYINPQDVLVDPVDVTTIFANYRKGDAIDFISFMERYASIESYGSYCNAFFSVGMPYIDVYEVMRLGESLDLQRIRSGESKYLIGELFGMKYPDVPIPEKNPMPRPVDEYFKSWKGPTRREFRKDFSINDFSGNQKWLMYCLERYLDIYERRDM